eukprot:3939100-Rhodomonas_salina.1
MPPAHKRRGHRLLGSGNGSDALLLRAAVVVSEASPLCFIAGERLPNDDAAAGTDQAVVPTVEPFFESGPIAARAHLQLRASDPETTGHIAKEHPVHLPVHKPAFRAVRNLEPGSFAVGVGAGCNRGEAQQESEAIGTISSHTHSAWMPLSVLSDTLNSNEASPKQVPTFSAGTKVLAETMDCMEAAWGVRLCSHIVAITSGKANMEAEHEI